MQRQGEPRQIRVHGVVYTLSHHFLNDRFPGRSYITDDRIEHVLLSPDHRIQEGNRTIYWGMSPGFPARREAQDANSR